MLTNPHPLFSQNRKNSLPGFLKEVSASQEIFGLSACAGTTEMTADAIHRMAESSSQIWKSFESTRSPGDEHAFESFLDQLAGEIDRPVPKNWRQRLKQEFLNEKQLEATDDSQPTNEDCRQTVTFAVKLRDGRWYSARPALHKTKGNLEESQILMVGAAFSYLFTDSELAGFGVPFHDCDRNAAMVSAEKRHVAYLPNCYGEGGSVFCFDELTGELQWYRRLTATGRHHRPYTIPALYVHRFWIDMSSERVTVFGETNDGLYCEQLDADTGDVRIRFATNCWNCLSFE